jgi:hypothetical protein
MADEIHAPGDDRGSERAPEEIRHPDGRIEHPHVRFERTDAYFRPILLILVALMVLAAFHLSIMLWFYHRHERYEASIKRSPFPLQQTPNEALPAAPRLEQVNRLAEIEKGNVYLREQAKERILHSYGSTPESNYLHIPIERAMDRLAVKKLPARTRAIDDDRKANGLLDAGASNSGRLFREKPVWFEK